MSFPSKSWIHPLEESSLKALSKGKREGWPPKEVPSAKNIQAIVANNNKH